MSITSIEGASAFQAARIRDQIGMAVLAKTMSVAKQQGQNDIELIESATEIIERPPSSSNNHHLDVTV